MKAFTALVAAIVCLLVIPTAAMAAEFTVDSTADEPDAGGLNGICLSVGLKCTLRASIEEANNVPGTKDTIKFSGSIFEGLTGDSVALSSTLTITGSVKIDGKFNGAQCNTSAGVKGPCVEVSGPASGSSLVVENVNEVEIEGLAITGATGPGAAAINVINAGVEARGNWLGVKLNGIAGANNKGIFLDPNSNGATIGGGGPGQGNVFANSSFEGLDVEGADNTQVLGNYFGVGPDGTTVAANGKNIEITGTAAFEATGNEVGATAAGPFLTSTACDGGCNVIAGGGLSTGVDLQGDGGNEVPAGGVVIHGNYIGLGANGTTVAANGTYDVLVGSAKNVTIGGESPGDANYIAGGGYGIYHENGEGFTAFGNVIGATPAETAATPPSAVGIFTYSPSTVDGPLVARNVVLMSGGFGMEGKGGGATIVENFFQGGNAGVFTVGLSPAVGNLIAANTIFEATNGILLEGDENEVLANEVILSDQAGIKVKQAGPPFAVGTTGNLIGGNTKADENLIVESGGDAIEIVNLEGTKNEVARNAGSGNGGLFIDLLAFEPGTEPNGPNGGIDPPGISSAAKTEAAGSAEPNALVRVFRKASASPGELDSFLGEAVADGSGSWKVTYGALPGETRIAATQTNEEGGTSEVSAIATTPADPSSSGGSGSNEKESDKSKDAKKKSGSGGKVPETTIRKAKVSGTKATFKFSASEKGAKFECKLDRKKFKTCKSPKTYKKLKSGKHVFKVRAVKGKAVDATPAKRKFKILK